MDAISSNRHAGGEAKGGVARQAPAYDRAHSLGKNAFANAPRAGQHLGGFDAMASRQRRIAICQLRMHWSIEDNLTAILEAMAFAARRQASICVFPELAITGFHRRIGDLASAQLLAAPLAAVREACARHAVAAAVGAPTFGAEGRIHNSHLLIDEFGHIAAVIDKNGLTPAEATFFARGSGRAAGCLSGLRCTSVICREIEDVDQVCEQLAPNAAQLIFWPGIIRPDPDKPFADPPPYIAHARQLARRTRATVVQANWPNSLNYPAESEHAGSSVVVDAHGKLLLSLPRAQAGVGIFALGEAQCEWQPQAA